MCQVGLSNDAEHFFAILAGICDSSGLTSVECPYDSLPEILHVIVFSYWIDIFYVFMYILLTSSNAYLLLHEVFLHICF